jgi:predicted Zn finger-like uncharacterized protein
MNNSCPSCGAIYAVSGKDIGRKLKCKKCSSALIVSEDGLVMEGGATPPPSSAKNSPMAVEEVEQVENDEEEVIVSKSKKGKKDRFSARTSGGGPNISALLGKVGGLPTVLFSFGVFLVIYNTFMSRIGEAAALRDEARPMKLRMEMASRMESVMSKEKFEKLTDDAERKKVMESMTKIDEEYKTKLKEANEDAANSRINNARSIYYDRWGTMFGLFFLAFGCIGFLRSEQPLVMRIVAGSILTLMMLFVFAIFSGCSDHGGGGDKLPNIPITGPGMK